MTKTPLKNIAASVRQRLLDKSRSDMRLFQELAQYYAMERFLYRLSLSTIQRISYHRIEEVISELGEGNELGVLKQDEEEGAEKPWETSKTKIELQRDDFPKRIEIVRANMLFIPKEGTRAFDPLKDPFIFLSSSPGCLLVARCLFRGTKHGQLKKWNRSRRWCDGGRSQVWSAWQLGACCGAPV